MGLASSVARVSGSGRNFSPHFQTYNPLKIHLLDQIRVIVNPHLEQVLFK